MTTSHKPAFILGIVLSLTAHAVQMIGRGCEDEVKAIMQRSVQFLKAPSGGFATSSRPEQKKFLDIAVSRTLEAKPRELLGSNPSAKQSGLVEVSQRDVPPPGKVFVTVTDYTPTDFGKERNRGYLQGEEDQVLNGMEGFEPVIIADEVIDSATGKPRRHRKSEIKVRREGTKEEPYLSMVVDKPGIIMFEEDAELHYQKGPYLEPKEWHRIRQNTASITRNGKPVNDEGEIDTVLKSHEDLFLAIDKKSGWKGAPPPRTSQVSYVRDAFVYKFRRLDIDPSKVDAKRFPKEFVVQHTIDRKIRIVDKVAKKVVSFPEQARANEIKSPLEYAKLYLSRRKEDRALLMEMGLGEYVEFMDAFEKAPVMEVSSSLKKAGFHFIESKGKLSTGSRLLEADKAAP